MARFIGLMSGTSMDGIDAALVDIKTDGSLQLIETHSLLWPDELKRQLKQLALPGDNEIDTMGEADAHAGELFAEAVKQLLGKAGLSPRDITAIGSHGQTIRHRPDASYPFTLQIGDPNRLAAESGITTVADFRRRDMAVGGQGAPLAPAFHHSVFGSNKETRVILNIGGIANLTLLPADCQQPVTGFDSGPGNRLMDDWISQVQGKSFDRDGDWGGSGKASAELLVRLIDDAYFRLAPPKSTGTETFNLTWLEQQAGDLLKQLKPEDVQATLLELTAVTVAEAIRNNCQGVKRVLVCGGGAHNRRLIGRIATQLPDVETTTTATFGLDPDWVEAAAFAWLASRTLSGQSGNLTDVTGAREAVILGAIYPA